MIKLTRLDGSHIYVNEKNIQWIEVLPDTAITFLAGARVIVREKLEEVLQLIGAADVTTSLATDADHPSATITEQ